MGQLTTDRTPQEAGDLEQVPGRKPMPFFPDFALIECLTALLLFVVLLLLASLTKPSLEEVADPTASGYVPRPEWYFLWIFQSLKYFKGQYEILGTFALPALLIALLVSLPFIDRRARPRRLLPRTRPVRLWPRLVAAGALVGLGFLTLSAATSEAPMTRAGANLTQDQLAGKLLFEKMGCASCHNVGGVGGTRGPDLTEFGNRPNANQRVLLHFTGIGQAPGSEMPGYVLSEQELRSLAAYLLSLKG